jgi:hypothetical protein
MEPARIGVVGYCPPTKYDEKKAQEYLEDAFDNVDVDFFGRDIVIVSGATNVGVLAQAYALATKRGYATGGVACEKAADYELFPLTEEPIIIGKEWGSESPIFVLGTGAIPYVDPEKIKRYAGHPHNGLDAIIRIGMGSQSMAETELMRALGKKTYEYDLIQNL